MDMQQTIETAADEIMTEQLRMADRGLEPHEFAFARAAVVKALHQSTNIWGDMYTRASRAEKELAELRRQPRSPAPKMPGL